MINISTSKKENSKENDQNLSNSNIQEKSISGSLISDTSPVYLFCTSKNGINSKKVRPSSTIVYWFVSTEITLSLEKM